MTADWLAELIQRAEVALDDATRHGEVVAASLARDRLTALRSLIPEPRDGE